MVKNFVEVPKIREIHKIYSPQRKSFKEKVTAYEFSKETLESSVDQSCQQAMHIAI